MRFKYYAVDFDGTIVTNCYPHMGELLPNAKRVLQRIAASGGDISLWTCRVDNELSDAVLFMKENDVPFNRVNENPPHLMELYGNDTRKIGADFYIDDKAMMEPVDWMKIERYLFSEN